MSSLQKISFRQLFQLKNQRFEEYHNVLQYLEAIPLNDKIKSLTDLTFGEVAVVKSNLRKPNLESMLNIFKTVFGLSQAEVYKINVVEFYHSLNWIKEEIQKIYDREVQNLSSTPDSKMKDAGIDDLNIFGEMNTLIMLGKDYGKSPQEVENWNYNLVFSLMLHQKISNDIQKRFNELNKPKNND